MQATSSQAPQATPSAQAGQPPFPLHQQSANRPTAEPLSTGTTTSATAAPLDVQAPTASQTPKPPPSGMTQQLRALGQKVPAWAFLMVSQPPLMARQCIASIR